MAEAAKLKIVLLGATGQTGQPLLRLCLERGHQVIIITRRGWCPRTGLRAAVNEYFCG